MKGAITVTIDHEDGLERNATTITESIIKVTNTTVAVTILTPAEGGFILADNKDAFSVGGTCTHNGESVQVTLTDQNSNSVTETATCDTTSWQVDINASALAEGAVSIYGIHHFSNTAFGSEKHCECDKGYGDHAT